MNIYLKLSIALAPAWLFACQESDVSDGSNSAENLARKESKMPVKIRLVNMDGMPSVEFEANGLGAEDDFSTSIERDGASYRYRVTAGSFSSVLDVVVLQDGYYEATNAGKSSVSLEAADSDFWIENKNGQHVDVMAPDLAYRLVLKD